MRSAERVTKNVPGRLIAVLVVLGLHAFGLSPLPLLVLARLVLRSPLLALALYGWSGRLLYELLTRRRGRPGRRGSRR